MENADIQNTQVLDLNGALRRVLKAASYREGLAKGLHEVCKAIDNLKKPVLCVLSDNCDEKEYKKLVEALCKEKEVTIVRIKDGKTLGEWVGLCKYDTSMQPRKISSSESRHEHNDSTHH
jgi:small subunit ribosomal protein S12e